MVTLLQQAQELQARIREILLDEWDPIGVNGMAGAEAEYDAYIRTIHQMLIKGQGRNEIADYLLWLEQDHMGLSPDRQMISAVADRLVRLAA